MRWLNSAAAFLIYAALMMTGFYSSIRWTNAPFTILAVNLTAGFSAYITKQLIQKQDKFNPCNGGTLEKRNPMD